jgi:aryl-alcohol dehydrogenase-like predicted oxidoreductase
LGVGFVAYGVLGRGFLAGAVTSVDHLDGDDARRQMPRFQGLNFEKNLTLFNSYRQLATSLGLTPAQLALAWLRTHNARIRSDIRTVVPLIGTSSVKRLEENLAAPGAELSVATLTRLDQLFKAEAAAGPRYSPSQFRQIDVDVGRSASKNIDDVEKTPRRFSRT